jgi:hypothetical protein
VSAGGLARNEYSGFADEFDRLVAAAGGPSRTRDPADETAPERTSAEGATQARTSAEGATQVRTSAEGATQARGKD